MKCEGAPIYEHFIPYKMHRQYIPRLDDEGKDTYIMLLAQRRNPILGCCEDLGYFVGYEDEEFVLMWSEKQGLQKQK